MLNYFVILQEIQISCRYSDHDKEGCENSLLYKKIKPYTSIDHSKHRFIPENIISYLCD